MAMRKLQHGQHPQTELELAWEKALPGRESAERNATLRRIIDGVRPAPDSPGNLDRVRSNGAPGGKGGAMVKPLRHRQTKEAATDMFDLKPLRHTSTLPNCEELSVSISLPGCPQ